MHRDLKVGLKTCLLEMADQHQTQWQDALPWVLLGRHTSYQPDLGGPPGRAGFRNLFEGPGRPGQGRRPSLRRRQRPRGRPPAQRRPSARPDGPPPEPAHVLAVVGRQGHPRLSEEREIDAIRSKFRRTPGNN